MYAEPTAGRHPEQDLVAHFIQLAGNNGMSRKLQPVRFGVELDPKTGSKNESSGFQVEIAANRREGVTAADMVTGMESVLKIARRWGAPVAAVIFFSLWCVAEAGRMGGSWLTWSGNWPLALMTLAVATAAWKPLVSLGFTAALLAGQLSY